LHNRSAALFRRINRNQKLRKRLKKEYRNICRQQSQGRN